MRTDMLLKKILKWAFVLQFKKGRFSVEELLKIMDIDENSIRNALERAYKYGLVKPVSNDNNREFIVTEKGRSLIKVIVTAGTFDIIHTGHIRTLKAAKELGDVLIVIVARDKNVLRLKSRPPVVPEEQRRQVVESLKPVDIAILGSEDDILTPIEKIKPDIIALGRDQKVDEEVLRKNLKKRGIVTEIVRLDVWDDSPLAKTSKILEKANKLMERENA
ncbi:MAG: adenylyltransferase/cytidyltransferase family protein [Candidatus Baldrarchaeia archaeon]